MKEEEDQLRRFIEKNEAHLYFTLRVCIARDSPKMVERMMGWLWRPTGAVHGMIGGQSTFHSGNDIPSPPLAIHDVTA